MMHVAHGLSPNKTYIDVLKLLKNEGLIVSPRGQETKELQPFIHHIAHADRRLCSVPGRKANPFFNMAENMWILDGAGDHEWVCSFNNKLKEYQLDNDQTDFNAPYGRRIRFYNRHRKGEDISINPYVKVSTNAIATMAQIDQLHHCYLSLRKDPFSRQAVVSLWNPLFDNFYHETKDRPCNTTIYFKIRDNRLNMTVCNRSNDIHLGLYGVNFVQFTHIQEFMAAALGVGLGQYVHISDSLHYYTSSEHTENILKSSYEFDVYDFVSTRKLSRSDLSLDDPNLGDYLGIASQVISESKVFKSELSMINGEVNPKDFLKIQFRYAQSEFARTYFAYLASYDLFKKGFYNQALLMLKAVFDFGLQDWAVCGLEFFCRKQNFRQFLETENKLIKDIVGLWFPNNQRSIDAVTRFCNDH
jgi:thymidylate synthase